MPTSVQNCLQSCLVDDCKFYIPEKYGLRASSIIIRIRDEIIDVICVRPPEAFWSAVRLKLDDAGIVLFGEFS